MRVWTEAYGCTLNQGETAMVRNMALRAGYRESETLEDADIVILGSCIVIDQTERRMWRRLRLMSRKRVVVVGCLPQVYEKKLREMVADVHIIPPGRMEYAEELFSTVKGLEPALEGVCAVIPISSGCLGSCTYCITRVARGELCSRRPEEIENLTRRAIELGAREIRLTCQDTGAYGGDIGLSISNVLERLENIEGNFFIRLGMMNPTHLRTLEEDVALFLRGSKAYRFLHIPIQSGSNNILQAMRRGYIADEAEYSIQHIRKMFPELTLSTDVIVGFPGETDKDHRCTVDMIKRLEPDIVNVTRFSPRPGTEAAEMEQVHGRTAKERSRELSALRLSISRRRKKQMMGIDVDVLVTETRDNCSAGRTRNYVPIVLETKHKAGEFLKARIVSTHTLHVVGEVL